MSIGSLGNNLLEPEHVVPVHGEYRHLLVPIAFLGGRKDLLDIALVYALINFISIVAVLKFFEYGELSRGGRGRP